MVREPLVHRNNIPGVPRASRRRNFNGNGPTSLSRERRRRCSECSPSLHFGWRIPKSPSAFARDPPPGITNANLHSVMPSPPSERCSGARRVFQCLGIPRTMWKFQPPSWKESPMPYATRRKIHKVELSLCEYPDLLLAHFVAPTCIEGFSQCWNPVHFGQSPCHRS